MLPVRHYQLVNARIIIIYIHKILAIDKVRKFLKTNHKDAIILLDKKQSQKGNYTGLAQPATKRQNRAWKTHSQQTPKHRTKKPRQRPSTNQQKQQQRTRKTHTRQHIPINLTVKHNWKYCKRKSFKSQNKRHVPKWNRTSQ